jgi:hypothetical protein
MVAIGLIAGVLCGTIIAVVWYRVGRSAGHIDGFTEGYSAGVQGERDSRDVSMHWMRRSTLTRRRMAERN